MKKRPRSVREMDNREIRRVTVRRTTAYLYASMYMSLGWTLVQTNVPVSRPVYVQLFFARDKNLRDCATVQKLWRQFDEAVGTIEAQERLQDASTRKAVLYGGTGAVLVLVPPFLKALFCSSLWQMILLFSGILICASAFLFYCILYKRRADEFSIDLCKKYQDAYQISKEAERLALNG